MSEETDAFVEALQKYDREFADMCVARHKMGEEKYGPFKFMEVDAFDEMAEELVDMANYARYNFIKLRLIQQNLAVLVQPETEGFRAS
jgi:hypothetical protein